tara:strand:- start:516 stop:812 length:297 start_codon:yes stop_codon:yes gene_type:complete
MGYIDLSSSISLEDISLSDFISLGDAEVDVDADDVHNLDRWIETSIDEARFGEEDRSLHQIANALEDLEQHQGGHSVDAKTVAVEILRMLIDLLEQTR